ncbi:MAG TPA: CPBP family glutamic-type intramembrane protease [Oscillospiraceae bacterium]|nr:CPBP family glutamic-type intramembrane protease [Oscillospiraceae bacterium]
MTWLKKNAIALLWFFIWIIVLPFTFPAYGTNNNVYSNLIFYAGLIAFVVIQRRKLFDEKSWSSLKNKKVWLSIFLAIVALVLAYCIAEFIISLFPNVPTGWGKMKCVGWLGVISFALSTVFLPPIAEELFFRQSLIVINSTKMAMLVTASFSVILFGLEHSLLPLGFMEGALIGIVFTVMYVKTKNIMVTVMAHFITNAVINGFSTIIFMIQLLTSK